jgi:hypothetical protein
VIDPALGDEPTSDAASGVHPKHRVRVLSRAKECFPQSGGIGVVFNKSRQSRALREPFRQGKAAPTGNVMGTRNFSGAPIYRTSVADADGGWNPASHQVRQGGYNLRPNALRTRGSVDCKTDAMFDLAEGIPEGQLQLCAPDFDSQQGEGCRSKMGGHRGSVVASHRRKRLAGVMCAELNKSETITLGAGGFKKALHLVLKYGSDRKKPRYPA